MRIISFNAEGVFCAEEKGFFKWVSKQDADIICLQDIRAREQDMESGRFCLEGYFSYCFENYAAKNLHASGGVAIYTRIAPKAVITGIGSPKIDSEGRYIQADFNSISISSLLIPGDIGGSSDYVEKREFLDAYLLFMKKQSRKRREVITCGTFNIAHTPKDVACYEDYRDRPGALQSEQRWMDHLLSYVNYVDCYREVEQSKGKFSFWETGKHKEGGIGWRIDYQIATQSIRSQVVNAGLYTKETFSRHAPVIVDYEWDLSE